MFNRYIEFRETRQFRKVQAASQKRRQMFILLGIMSALLLTISGIKAVMPTESAKSAVSPAKQQALQDIQKFSVVVTKPLETLSQDDLDFVQSKANDPCYEDNAMLPAEQMIKAITVCKSLQ